MTAAMLCGYCGILDQTIENTAAYVKHYIELIRDHPDMIVKASSQAQAATDYILAGALSLDKRVKT